MRSIGFGAKPPLSIRFVVLIIPLEPHNAALAFEREHVRGNAIEKPPIVTDDDRTAGVIEQRFFERA
jgi:hypothetical protein